MAASKPFQVLLPSENAPRTVLGFGGLPGPLQVLIPTENAPRTVF